MIALPPWANGPFELMVHAETHLRNGDDFDRRIALISYDDAIEVSISTYLSLHPIQRGNRSYSRMDVDKWLHNFHSKLDFLEEELRSRGHMWAVDRSHIVWAHEHRNEQYHGGKKGTPEKNVIELMRKSALWVFSVLFDVSDVERVLEEAIAANTPSPSPQRDGNFDRAIDREYGVVELAGEQYYTSELLFSADYTAYCEVGGRLSANPTKSDPGSKE
jgi:hypothetical protein